MATYTVKQLSQKLNISEHTIRFYDDQGLLPDVQRDKNGTRLFTDDNIEWINLVLCLRNTGMSITDIKNYIKLCKEGDSTVHQRYQIILKQKEKAEADLRQMQKRLSILNMKQKCYEDIIVRKNGDACNPAAKQHSA